MPKPDADVLLALGFEDVGCWRHGASVGQLSYDFDGLDPSTQQRVLDTPNALYAFLEGVDVLYIGKTTRSIRRRFATYCRPGSRQSTNIKCNANIRQRLQAGGVIRIAIFTPISQLQNGEFEIDLAAGLENSLISSFEPPWNGRDGARPVSDDTQREADEEAELSTPDAVAPTSAEVGPVYATFHIRLGGTYYDRGIINPGIEASGHLGAQDEPVLVYLGGRENAVLSKINRTANRSGGVRITGGSQRIAAWFQRNFQRGETVTALVLDRDRILLQMPQRRTG